MTTGQAIQFGTVAATFLAALTVILAFMRPTLRYFKILARGGFSQMGDHLCAGIWVSAVGSSILAVFAMIRLATGIAVPLVAAVGWTVLGGGYFLHFTAWRASFRGDIPGGDLGHLRLLFILVTLGTGAGVTAYLLSAG